MTGKISTAIQEAVQRVDAQILCHLGLIQDLKSQRNALMPISQLPAEILGRIFHEVRGHNGNGYNDDDPFCTSASYSEPSLEWISVSHVSRHWRNVATNDASLWTDLPLENPRWTMIMLERWRMATIPAIALRVDELDKRVVAALTPHIPRVSYLTIPNMARGTLKRVLSGLPSTTLRLEALSISSLKKTLSRGHTWYHRSTSPSLDEALTFPDNILCHTPKLHHLRLNDIIIKSNSPLLSRLTTFSMSGIPEKSKLTPQQFKTMLESAPYLKRLYLKDVCPSIGSNRSKEWTAPVLMQHLEYLDVEETIPRLICFFRIFSATNLLKGLFININYQEEHASELSVLFAAVNQPYLYSVIGSSTDVRRLEIANYDGQLFTRASQISVLERNLEPDKRQRPEYDHNSESMTIWLDTGSDEIEPEDLVHLTDLLLSSLFNNLSWTGLSELGVSSLDYASPEVLASTFGTVPQLRIIAAEKYIAPWLIAALNHSSDDDTDPAMPMSLPFPGLQHIDLGRTSLIEDDEDFEALCECLLERQEYGTPIISLKLNHEFLEEEVLSSLKEYIEHIILTPSESQNERVVVDDYSPYNHTWYM